jgi:uncharacterized OsmC-like protein
MTGMSLIAADLGPLFEGLRKTLTSMENPAAALVTNRAEVRLVENQHSEATVRGFTIVQDEPTSVFGGGRGPTPTDFFIAAVGFCENVVFVRQAGLAGLRIDALETVVTGRWDRRGLFEIDGVEASFQEINVETRVTTSEPVEKVVDAARATHRRCPVHVTLQKATKLAFTLVINGQQVAL